MLIVKQAPRGLSAEEKRVRLLEIFHETVRDRVAISRNWLTVSKKDFFQVGTTTR